MSDLKSAAKLALDALETLMIEHGSIYEKAIAALKEALAQRTEQNFCSRCGKRTPDLTHIHTCTPPREGT